MPFIFKYGPESGWELDTGGTNRLLRDSGPLVHQFSLKNLHSWVGRGADLGLQDWPDGKVQRVKVRAPCRPDFLAMNEGIFLWIQDWMILEVESVQSPVAGTRELIGSASWTRAAGNPPKCWRCSARSSIWLQRTQKAEGTSRCLWRLPKPWQTADYDVWWGSFPMWMTRNPNLVILLANHLLDVKFLLVCEHKVWQCAICHLLEDFLNFWALMAT